MAAMAWPKDATKTENMSQQRKANAAAPPPVRLQGMSRLFESAARQAHPTMNHQMGK
jgi:hypothetical protein